MADASGTHPGRMATLAFCLSLALVACTPGQSAAQVMIVCAELADSERTRAVVESDAADGSITHFEIVTPEFLWEAPGQRETPRFPAGRSDVSPDLAGRAQLRLEAVRDAAGEVRIIDFGVRTPDALELEGLRGSLVLHESFQNQRALASLFYAASGNLVSVTALECRRFPAPAAAPPG